MAISPPIQLGTLGMDDTLLLMVLALVLLGPRRLPQVGRQIGKLMYEFRKASNDFKYQLEEELRTAEEGERRKREEAERQLAEAQKAVIQAQSAAEQALEAAQKAQSAAQAAQSAATDPLSPNLAFAAPDAAAAETASPATPSDAAPDMVHTYGDGETVAPGSPAALPPATEPIPPPAEAGLRVQPPTTGEQVPAARPGRASSTTAEPGEQPLGASVAPGEPISVKKEVPAEDHPAATESTAHHG